MNEAFMQPVPRTLWQRLGFGHAAVPREALDDRDGFAPGALITRNTIYLDWRDRLRMLVTGRLELVVASKTDKVVGQAVSWSRVSVLPPEGRGQ
jgi:hypothetical protein